MTAPGVHLNSTEEIIYRRFRDAFETYQKWAWELEDVASKLKETPGPEDASRLVEEQKNIEAHLAESLGAIPQLAKEAEESLGKTAVFAGIPVGQAGLANIIQEQIERDVLAALDANYPNILKSALLNAFVAREKETRSSIYKKRVRRGFRGSVESLIEEEKQKNAAWREDRIRQCGETLSPKDIELLQKAFRLRMTRHGIEPAV